MKIQHGGIEGETWFIVRFTSKEATALLDYFAVVQESLEAHPVVPPRRCDATMTEEEMVHAFRELRDTLRLCKSADERARDVLIAVRAEAPANG